jgi:hypothetical protein
LNKIQVTEHALFILRAGITGSSPSKQLTNRLLTTPEQLFSNICPYISSSGQFRFAANKFCKELKMNNKFTKSVVVGLVVVLVLSLGAVAAFAQDDTTPDTAPGTGPQPALPFGRGGFGGPRGHHGRGGGADEDALAAALGVTVEELQAAREQAQAERLAQAVADGTLTQEQVDSMQAMRAVKEYIDKDAILADVLGLTVEELEAAHADGTLRELLSDINIDPTAMQEQMQAATEAAVAEALAAGDITAEQAELISEQIANGAGMMDKFGGQHGPGDFGGRGGPQGNSTGYAPFQNAPAFGA